MAEALREAARIRQEREQSRLINTADIEMVPQESVSSPIAGDASK